jgi:hypothetical protein
MKKLVLSFAATIALVSAAFSGESYSGKEMKQVVPPPCPEWYGDNEWNVSLSGAYAFTGEDWSDDTYIEADHAWGGTIDAKYFFHRYFGVGVEGWAARATRDTFDLSGQVGGPISFTTGRDERLIGAVLGTLTLRFPIHCSRFAPYIWGGGGAIFGGGERDQLVITGSDPVTFDTIHNGSRTELMGQFGGGIEIRFTRHIGWMNDFSWNVVDGPRNNFGMVRTGINFAF